jgi:hypothetical protein
MDSPSSAGTRSHILPGESDLGLWYEDTTSMYRIEDSQVPYTSTYFGYSATINEDIDLDDPPLTVGVDTANQSDWIEFIRSEVDIASASYPVSYSTVSGGGVTMYASSGTAANALNGTGWQVSATSENHWLEFHLIRQYVHPNLLWRVYLDTKVNTLRFKDITTPLMLGHL